jgi:hypothetical protein
MRSALVVTLLALATTAATMTAVAGPVAHTELSADDITLRQTRGYETLSFAGGRGLGVVGEPDIPAHIVHFVIPDGMTVGELMILEGDEVVLEGEHTIQPVQLEVPIGESAPWVEPDERIYASDLPYPPERAVYLGDGFLGGYRIATVALYPVQLKPASGRLVLAPELTVELSLESSGRRAADRMRVTAGSDELYRRLVRGIVANPEDVDALRNVETDVVSGWVTGGFAPRYTPSLEGSPVEYVIVTSNALEPYFQELADWKTRKGVPAVVRTVSWIDANYPGGCDTAERIRFFLKDAYASWGTTYVLLGGDTEIVPTRYGRTSYYGGLDIPTDLYYSDLDGNWNGDGDGIFGEGYRSEESVGDGVDLYADVFVGRAPVSNVVEVEAFLAKCEAYRESPVPHFTDRNLYLGEVLFPYDWENGPYSLDGAVDIVEPGLPFVPAHISDIRLYANIVPFPDAYPISDVASVDSLEQGYNLVAHVGHGNKDAMRVGLNNYIGMNDISGLTNGIDKAGFLWLLNCTSAAIDYDCIAERAVTNPNGGAFAALGPTRYAFPTTCRDYYWDWLDLLYVSGCQEIGPLLGMTLALHASFGESGRDNTDRWTQFATILLGDPEIAMRTQRPSDLSVAFSGAMSVGEDGMTFNVTDPGFVEGAKVCVSSSSGDVYTYGITDGTGHVHLDFTPTLTGVLQVTVTHADYYVFESNINVVMAAGAYVHLTDVTIDDDSTGGSSGNSNGKPEPDETLELDVTVRNAGIATAAAVTAVISSTDPYIVIETDTVLLGDLEPAATVESLAAFRLFVTSDCPNNYDAELTIDFSEGARSAWQEEFTIRVYAPDLVHIHTQIDDSYGGDGDGVPETGETVTLLFDVINEGNGDADGVTGVLSYGDPLQVGFSDSTDVWGDISAGVAATGSDGFEFTVLGDITDRFQLMLVDEYGKIWTKHLDVHRPDPSDSLWGDVVGTTINLHWKQALEPDIRGYDVWRSEDQSGPYAVANTAIVEGVSYFADAGLEDRTRYYYYVVAVDSSGNASLSSPVLSISTNPPSLTGWPLATSAAIYSSAVVVDLDGDGSNEILVASEELYAWHADGMEVRDGDGDPRTGGIFIVDGQGGYRSTPAVGEVDGDSGVEIVAAAWADVGTGGGAAYEVFVWNGEDGSVVSGWPVTTGKFCWASPALADLDNDGRNEVIIPCADGKLYCWSYNGSEFIDGDDDPLTVGVFADLGTPWVYASPAIADIDGDGDLEILQPAATESVYCFNADGSNVPGWPISIGVKAYGSPAVGDVDGDGDLEIAIMSLSWYVWLFDHEGNALAGWPQLIASSGDFPPSPVLADITGDGFLELVQVGSDGEIRIWDYQGNTIAGWPQFLGTSVKSSPAIANIDADPDLELIVGSDSGKLFALNLDGTIVDGWPIQTGADLYGSPTVADVDGDGDLEVVIGGMDTGVYVWDCEGAYDDGAGIEWGCFLHDLWRTQFYGFEMPVGVSDDDVADSAGRLLEQNVPNPFNPLTTIEFVVPAAGDGAPVSLSIYTVRGSLVRTLLNSRVEPGRRSAVWDGRDGDGRSVASGVYFYRLTVDAASESRKMLLIK